MTDAELESWLRDELGLDEYRRVARVTETSVLLSKFEDGFAAGLFETVAALPELFDELLVRGEYDCLAATLVSRGESRLRTEVWRRACEALIRRLASERGVDPSALDLIIPGLESVQAVMDAVLWSAPTIGDEDYQPRPGEREAFEALLSDAPERDIFTRYYGSCDGLRVENYCPGSQFARRLLRQAWSITTGQR